MRAAGRQYLRNILVSFDQLGNALTGGDPDETLSSRIAKKSRAGSRPAYALCRMLHWFDKNHCVDSIEEDEGGEGVL